MSLSDDEPAGAGRERERDTDVDWRILAGGIAAILALIFVVQNRDRTEIRFLFLSWDAGVWFALLVTLVLGFVIGWFASRSFTKRRSTD